MAFRIDGVRHEESLLEEELALLERRLQDTLPAEEFHRLEPGLPTLARENVVARILVEREALAADMEVDFAEIKAEYERMTAFYGGEEEMFARFEKSAADRVSIQMGIEKSLKVQNWLDRETGVIEVTEGQLEEEARRLRAEGISLPDRTEEQIRASLEKLVRDRIRGSRIKDLKKKLRAAARVEFGV